MYKECLNWSACVSNVGAAVKLAAPIRVGKRHLYPRRQVDLKQSARVVSWRETCETSPARCLAEMKLAGENEQQQ